MDLTTRLRNRVNPGGFCIAAMYIIVVVVVFVITAATTKPSNVGYDWIPFALLSFPWYSAGFGLWLLVPGLIVNAGLMYILGAQLHTFWHRAFKQ